jgi:hypothetical protein
MGKAIKVTLVRIDLSELSHDLGWAIEKAIKYALTLPDPTTIVEFLHHGMWIGVLRNTDRQRLQIAVRQASPGSHVGDYPNERITT